MMVTKTITNSLMSEDLKRSNLSPSDIKKLKYKALTKKETYKLTDREIESYLIPYFDIKGKVTDFYRIRFTGVEKGFGAKKKIRYTQPANTQPRFYFPPTIKWKELLEDNTQPIYFTEGEKKSAVLCKHNYPCIGLGGVWSWKSKHSRTGLVDDYKKINWDGRPVIIVFDSDIETNPLIRLACIRFCDQLLADGAIVFTKHIPHEDGEKLGIDDYFIKYGVSEFEFVEATPYHKSVEFHKLNNDYVIVKTPTCIIQQSNNAAFKATEFTSVIAADRMFYTSVFNPQGEERTVEKPAAKAWLNWKHRNVCEKLVYEPGAPTFTEDGNYNVYRHPDITPTKPKKDQCKPFLDLVDYMFSKESKEVKQWFLQWCAYPLQYPGTKLFTFVLLHSTGTGVGKSLIGLTLGKLYGENFCEVGHEITESTFNQWAVNKQFVLGDEISAENTGHKLKKEANTLKRLFTRETVEINQKGVKQYWIPDCINYLLTSNHPNAVYLEKNDRRGFIVGVPIKKLADSFYAIYDKWYKSKENQGALLHYLLNSVDTTGFRPKAEPPLTVSKSTMIGNSMTDVAVWCEALNLEPDSVLKFDEVELAGDIWTCTELNMLYCKQTKDKITNMALGIKLQEAGITPIRLHHPNKTYYVVRNQEKWEFAKSKDIHKHHDDMRGLKKSDTLPPILKKKRSKK